MADWFNAGRNAEFDLLSCKPSKFADSLNSDTNCRIIWIECDEMIHQESMTTFRMFYRIRWTRFVGRWKGNNSDDDDGNDNEKDDADADWKDDS
jgi:hypothetical protein